MIHRLLCTVAGGVLSLGAPVGLVAVAKWRRRRSRHCAPSPLDNDRAVFAYVTLSTALAFSTFGYLLGYRLDQLASLSETDSLTGLYNARGLSQRIAIELARWKRYHQPLSVVIVDVDGLKDINDRFGHAAGDAALREVAAAIRAERREGDLAARWGGDEFAIVATNTGSHAAEALAERVRHVLSQSGEPFPLAASFGIAALEGDDDGRDVDPDSLMRAADVALYAAKKRGGNAVAIACS